MSDRMCHVMNALPAGLRSVLESNGVGVGRPTKGVSTMVGDSEEMAVCGQVQNLGPYASVREVMAALIVAAAVVVRRDEYWSYDAIRNYEHGPILERHCFCCGISRNSVRLIRHHIVQVQNGGSNTKRNLVAICQHCHASIHPWLPKPIRGTDFVTPFDAAAAAVSKDEP